MPNMALIDGAGTVVSGLAEFVDGYPDATHKLETTTGGAPLEDGRRATDHAVARQERLVLTGWVSDFNGGNRPREAWDEIRRLHKKKKIMTVITEWGVYRNMLIRRAEAPQTARGMRCTLELEELIIVGVTDNELPASILGGPAVGRSGEIDRGRVALVPDTSTGPTPLTTGPLCWHRRRGWEGAMPQDGVLHVTK